MIDLIERAEVLRALDGIHEYEGPDAITAAKLAVFALPAAQSDRCKHGTRRPHRCRECEDEPPAGQSEPRQEPEPRDAHFGGHSYEASLLRDLLACIHGDGGHYVAEHGLNKAVEDAHERIATLMRSESDDALERMKAALDALDDDDVSGASLILYEGIKAREGTR